MLLRIALIIALLAGIGAGYVGMTYVKDRMVTTMNERDQEKKDKEIAQTDLSKTKKTLGDTQNTLKKTQDNLAKTETALDTMTTRAKELDEQKVQITTQLEKTRADRDAAQQSLTKWNLLNVTVEGVKELQTNIVKISNERDAYIKENKLMNEKNVRLQAKLEDVIGTNAVPAEPAGLKGKIVAVDPKYQFVVLDVGGNQGIVPRGQVLVSREGKFMGKLRITTVDQNSSIANILPEWKQGDLLEGDVVINTVADAKGL